MPSTSRRAKAAARAGLDDDLEGLRASFDARLRSERVHLVTLSAALARAEDHPAQIFADLRDRAHRIRGGAAILAIEPIAAAACSLEFAAILAVKSRAGHADTAVWAALVALVRLMGRDDEADEMAALSALREVAAG